MSEKDENEEVKSMVEKAHELFDDKIERLDKILAMSIERELLDDFIDGYLQLRDSGFQFEDAMNTSAEQLNLDPDEEDEEAEKD